EILSDFATLGEERALEVLALRWAGLRRLLSTIPDDEIDYQSLGGYELLLPEDQPALEHLDRINDMVQPIVGARSFHDATGRLPAFGFAPETVTGVVANPLEGELHSGKLVMALQRRCRAAGVEILTGAKVTAIE